MLKVLFPWKQNNTKKVLFAMEQVVNEAEPSAEELPPEDLPLLPCHVCNRTFLPKPLKKHIPICEQALRRKRKPFDSLKQRVEGTDMAPFYQKSYLKRISPEMSSVAQAGDLYGNNKVSKWREKHFELQNTIKNAKGSSTRSDMSTHPPSSNSVTPNRKTGHLNVGQTSSNERCPVCDRSFGPKAFDRHVEFCKEQRNRVQVHKSPAVVQQAKERLEARINYRVPPLRQSKRSLVRDKYLPSSQTSVLLRSNSTVQGKSTTSLSTSVTNMTPNRRQVNNERSVERNNNKKETTNKTRLDRTIGDCGDTKESIKNETSITKSFQTRRTIPAKKINKTEVNHGLQGITVSSLSVEKDKKLVTWKDTVKVQPKVTPAISLTTTSTNTKKKVVTGTLQGESGASRSVDKAPSLGRVVRSRLLQEKLNMFVSKKKSPQVDEDLTRFFENLKEKRGNNKISVEDNKELEFEKNNKAVKQRSMEKILDFPDLSHISEEGEVDEESPKICHRRVSFDGDYNGDQNPLNITQVIETNQLVEEDLMPKLTNKNNASEEHSIVDVSDLEENTNTTHNEDRIDYSDDESKTEEGSSSLCLRLPLEGLESKVKLRNNDLDPDQKLKKNIKSFYEIIKAGKCKMPNRREQLSLLESSKEIKFLEDELLLTSSGCSFFGKNDVDDEPGRDCGELLPSISTNDHKKEFDTILDEPMESIAKNTESKSTTLSASTKDVTFRTASRQSRSWKTRKKLQKYRMCVNCLIRNVRNRKKAASKIRNFDGQEVEVLELFSSDDEWVFDSPQILGTFENLRKTSEDILKRKSKSASYLSSCRKNEIYTGKCSLSLPNIRQNGNVDDADANSCNLRVENSFDNMVPRKRRKISPSYLDSGDDEKEVEKNLRQISKISTSYMDSGDDDNEVGENQRQNFSYMDSGEDENEVEKHLRQNISKISTSYTNNSGDYENEIEKSLRQNISKIRRRKVGQTPPLILKYENTGLASGKISSTDVLYLNNVFAAYRTPERSEAESVIDCDEDDGILEYGDEILEDWDAGEEELFRQLERKKHLTQFEQPTRSLSAPKITELAREEINHNTERSDEELIVGESSTTLKYSSGCTIVNMPFDEDDCEEIDVVSSMQMLPELDESSPEPEKVEEIVLSPKKTEPNLKNSSGCIIANMSSDEDELEEINVVSSIQILPEVDKRSPKSEKLEEVVLSKRKTKPNMVCDEIPCRLPRIIPKNKQKSPLRSANRLSEDDFKLPIIRNLTKQSFEADILSEKLVQVPSRSAKASISFCQQTSKMLVDNSSSFNREDFPEEDCQELSPESQKNKSNRRLGTSNLVGLEIRKALQEEVRNVSPKEEIFNINSTPTAEELYPDNAIMYEEFKKYEEMYRREKEGRSSSSKKQKKTADFGINIDDSCKIYGDSAYESLNRKQQSTEQDSSDQLKEFGSSNQSAATTPGERLPKFCHECGNKYPVASAKFCVECGVRRLVL